MICVLLFISSLNTEAVDGVRVAAELLAGAAEIGALQKDTVLYDSHMHTDIGESTYTWRTGQWQW
jgi:hypothetical protein